MDSLIDIPSDCHSLSFLIVVIEFLNYKRMKDLPISFYLPAFSPANCVFSARVPLDNLTSHITVFPEPRSRFEEVLTNPFTTAIIPKIAKIQPNPIPQPKGSISLIEKIPYY
jgi:hypothetical protein